MPTPTTLADWARVLRSMGVNGLEAAGRAPEAEPGWAGPWNGDDFGHRRPVDDAFFAWRQRGNGNASGAPATPPDDVDNEDTLLWAALTNAGSDPLALLASGDAAARDRTDSGALFGQQAGRVPLEVWTERELSCLHALDRLRTERPGITRDIETVLNNALAWHIENLQPDNATNHPWAIHVFLRAAVERDEYPAQLYAEALLHNCQVSMGRPDAFSAHILLDAAEALDAKTGQTDAETD